MARDDHGHVLPTDGAESGGTESDGQDTGVGFRTYGKSKDSRDDLPQIVIGMAVTRAGPRCGCGAGPGTQATKR